MSSQGSELNLVFDPERNITYDASIPPPNMPPRIKDPNLVFDPERNITYDPTKHIFNPRTGRFSHYVKPNQPTLSTGIWELKPPLPISKRWDLILPEPYQPTPTPLEPQYDNEFYMTFRGIYATEPRHIVKVPDLPKLEALAEGKGKREWVYTRRWVEEGDEYIENLPFADGIGWRALDGRKSFGKETHESIVDLWHQADTYWIAISCLIYGDAAWWPWVKAQHLMYFQIVLQADGDT